MRRLAVAACTEPTAALELKLSATGSVPPWLHGPVLVDLVVEKDTEASIRLGPGLDDLENLEVTLRSPAECFGHGRIDGAPAVV